MTTPPAGVPPMPKIDMVRSTPEGCWHCYKVTAESPTTSIERAYATLSSMFQQERAENERLREALADAYEDILMEHSYPAGVGNLTQAEEHEHRKNNGWMHHSYMSNQEHALSVLLEHGIYEMHQNGNWYRKASTPKETTND